MDPISSFENLPLIWIKGAGEMSSGVAATLFRCRFPIVMTELAVPLAIRRTVSFGIAMLDGNAIVEGIPAEKCKHFDKTQSHKHIQVLDSHDFPDNGFRPKVIVDARMTKQSQPDHRNDAPLVIGLGPGFDAGVNCHVVIETMRGHELGRIIWKGQPIPNTGIPGVLGGASKKRLVLSPRSGFVNWLVEIGDIVQENQVIGVIDDDTKISAGLTGIVRGLIHPAVRVSPNMKIGDIDPRGKTVNINQISEKARCIGRGVLEAILSS